MNEEKDNYEPTEDEMKEIEDLINKDSEKEDSTNEVRYKIKNWVSYLFKSESHWEGFLRIHGILWNIEKKTN